MSKSYCCPLKYSSICYDVLEMPLHDINMYVQYIAVSCTVRYYIIGPLSLRLRRGLLDPRLRIGHLSHLFCRGPPRHPGSSALRLGHRTPAPAAPSPSCSCLCPDSSLLPAPSRVSFLLLSLLFCSGPPRHPGSSALRLGPAPSPSCSCLCPGSSLLRHLPGLFLPAPSRVSFLLLSLLWIFHTLMKVQNNNIYLK